MTEESNDWLGGELLSAAAEASSGATDSRSPGSASQNATWTPGDPDDLTPVTGAWMVGDPLGQRRITTVVSGRRFLLEGGGYLERVDLAHEQWGELNEDRSNAVLVCHALTGDSHAAGRAGPGHVAPGWWESLIGPGKAIDTEKYFVVCVNVLGGCQGSTGPASQNPATGKPYGSQFPMVSIRDMVRSQALLADQLGIPQWKCVIGGSMGGMQALEWATMYPDRVRSTIVASSTTQASAQQIAWSHIGRGAITADPGFRGGDYYDSEPGCGPHRGLELARMVAQVTYRSDEVFTERFGRTLIRPLDFGEGTLFDVEGYLEYHGAKLVQRFDANSYIRLNRAMDLHDLARGRGGVDNALRRITGPMLVVTVRSDSLYPPEQQISMFEGVRAVGGRSELLEIDSPHGHDGFLIETTQMAPKVRQFLAEIQ